MSDPTCTIIAGPNGAGKTTFALNYLLDVRNCQHFINADLIASGLSPLMPELKLMAASRLYLSEIKKAIVRREDFAFETTLSGKSYLKLIRSMQGDGWLVELFYLYLPDVQMSIERVAERVKHGGHDIPVESLKRRYPRSLRNLLELYSPLCDGVICLDNSQEKEKIIFLQYKQDRTIENEKIFLKLSGDISHERS